MYASKQHGRNSKFGACLKFSVGVVWLWNAMSNRFFFFFGAAVRLELIRTFFRDTDRAKKKKKIYVFCCCYYEARFKGMYGVDHRQNKIWNIKRLAIIGGYGITWWEIDIVDGGKNGERQGGQKWNDPNDRDNADGSL